MRCFESWALQRDAAARRKLCSAAVSAGTRARRAQRDGGSSHSETSECVRFERSRALAAALSFLFRRRPATAATRQPRGQKRRAAGRRTTACMSCARLALQPSGRRRERIPVGWALFGATLPRWRPKCRPLGRCQCLANCSDASPHVSQWSCNGASTIATTPMVVVTMPAISGVGQTTFARHSHILLGQSL